MPETGDRKLRRLAVLTALYRSVVLVLLVAAVYTAFKLGRIVPDKTGVIMGAGPSKSRHDNDVRLAKLLDFAD